VTFVAEATRVTAATPERVFDTLAHHDAWGAWMPASFRPKGKRHGTLRAGARPKVRIAAGLVAVPAKLEVTVADRPREITWCGGVPGLYAEHRFLLEPLDTGGTRIRSRSPSPRRSAASRSTRSRSPPSAPPSA
jgi:uncharacterized protein YndB with AHSA1/START domain